MSRSRRVRTGLQVFAVEHDAIQITWSRLPQANVTLEIADQSIDIDASPPDWYRGTAGLRPPSGTGGPGAVTVTGLDPSTRYDICMSGPGLARRPVAAATTLEAPPGRLLTKFATISDCHFGEKKLGALHRLHDPVPRPRGLEPYASRCAAAAIEEAHAWGAERLVAKGDLTQDGRAAEFRTAVGLLSSARVPVDITFGNHDVRGPVGMETAAKLFADAGISAAVATRSVDLRGARLVLSHTPVPFRHAGRMAPADISDVVSAASDTEGAVVVALHHPLARLPVHTHYPPSLRWKDSRELARGLKDANPRSLVIAGHSHRNRRYEVMGVTVVEVGSTKDYPGQWGGYSVYEGGIRQVVRRVERRDAIAWTQMTARAIGGLWRWWSPGRLEDRCWTLTW